MEVEQEKAVWPDPLHPNYERWRRGRSVSEKRAEVVQSILSTVKSCENLDILDIGSGEGGTSSLFSKLNKVISFDLSILRLKTQQQSNGQNILINGNAEYLPFSDASFDLIILQDVIEHIDNRESLINELSRVLKREGIIYLSTPNKYSILNMISDPHWGIPLLSLFRRQGIKKYFLNFIRKSEAGRTDIAELLSLKELKLLFKDYRYSLKTREIVRLLSVNPDGILWSSFHLILNNIMLKSGLFLILNKIANNKSGLINKFLTPTFYIILMRRESRATE